MISISFINNEYEELIASNPFLSLEKAIDTVSNEIDNTIDDFFREYDKYTVESSILEEVDHEKEIYFEAGKTNIFEKIGNSVMEIFRKFQNLIKSVIEKIKNIGFKNKSNEEKMKSLLDYYKKNEPEKYKSLKDDVVVAFKNGELNPIDMKSVKEMNDAYEEILRLSKQKDVKPDSLKAKFEAMKKKFSDTVDKGTVAKTAGAVTAIIGAGLAIATFRSKLANSNKTISECNKIIAEDNAKFLKTLNEMKTANPEFASEELSKAQIMKNVHYWTIGEVSKCITKEKSTINTFDHKITQWIAKHMKKESKQFLDDSEKNYKVIKKREDDERKAERKKNREDSADRAYGQMKGQYKYKSDHKDKVAADNWRDSYNKARGQNQAKDDDMINPKHQAAIRDEARIKADAQRDANDKAILYSGRHNEAMKKQAKIQAKAREKAKKKSISKQNPPQPNPQP